MSLIIPLDILPNQSLSVVLDGSTFDLTLKSSDTSMFLIIVKDDITLIENSRAVSSELLIPYKYLEGETGNFVFFVQNEEIPYYTNFGITQTLVYLTASEVEAARGT